MLTCFVACDINNKQTRREGTCLCVLLLIYQQRENRRDFSFKEKEEDGCARE